MPRDRTNRTILVVDDEELFRRTTADALRAASPDYRVLVAADGLEALEQSEAEMVDVVVTDLRMPLMGGLELVLALAERSFGGAIIVVTSFDEPAVEARLKKQGIFGFVEKPVDLPRLIAIIRAAADSSRLDSAGLGTIDFAQLVELERESGLLRVNCDDRVGELLFQDGVLLDAEFAGRRGDDAAIELLGWVGRAQIGLLTEVRPTRQTVTQSLDDLISRARERAASPREPDAASSSPSSRPTRPADSGRQPGKERSRMNVKETLDSAMTIDGALAVALVDFESGMNMGQAGGGPIDIEVAGAGNAEVMRSKMQVMNRLGLDDTIEDILISLGKQYHLIRPLSTIPNVFLYLALDRSRSNLAMARHKLSALEKTLEV